MTDRNKREMITYSPIRDFAMAIGLSRWRERVFGMFTACFDAAGTENDQPIIAVAGFLSSAEQWVEFDAEWGSRLQREELPFFHAVDFAHSRGPFTQFEGQEQKRRALLGDLLSIIRNHVFHKFGCIAHLDRWRSQISPDNIKALRTNAYAVVSMLVAGKVDRWAQIQGFQRPVELVFEDGDTGKGALQAGMRERMSSLA